MKADKATLGAALDRPNSNTRFYLFHGADESSSRALGDRLLKGLGAVKFAIDSKAVKSDPALLGDEASAMTLFGDKRAIWIEPAGDELAPSFQTVLEAPAAESPVIALSGVLRKTSALLKLAEAHSAALAHVSYPLEGREADRMVMDLGRSEGLRMAGDVASRIAEACGNNQATIASELAKFALYLGASNESPRELDQETIDLLGAESGESDWLHLGDLALDGRLVPLTERLQRLPPGAPEAIPIVRAIQRRILQLAPLRARIEGGERVDGVLASMGKSLFWKDKALMQRLLSRWNAARLAQLGERMSSLERRLIFSSAPSDALLGEELIAIARVAAR